MRPIDRCRPPVATLLMCALLTACGGGGGGGGDPGPDGESGDGSGGGTAAGSVDIPAPGAALPGAAPANGGDDAGPTEVPGAGDGTSDETGEGTGEGTGAEALPIDPAAGPEAIPRDGSVLATLHDDAAFATFAAAADEIGLSGYLADPDQRMTLFVPTEAAFDGLSRRQREALLGDADRLSRLVHAHVLNEQRVTAASLAGFAAGRTVDGLAMVHAGAPVEAIVVNGVPVSRTTTTAQAVVHAIDDFAVPTGFFEPDPGSLADRLSRDDRFARFTRQLDATRLLRPLGDVDRVATVFAVRELHYVSGGTLGAAFYAADQADERELARFRLADELRNHIVERTAGDDLAGSGASLATLAGESLDIGDDAGTMTANGLPVIEASAIVGANGTVHAIDHPLWTSRADERERRADATVIDLLERLDARDAYGYGRDLGDCRGLEPGFGCDPIYTDGGFDLDYGADPYPHYSGYQYDGFASRVEPRPWRFFLDLIDAADMRETLSEPGTGWTLLVPRDGEIPIEDRTILQRSLRGYADGDDYEYGYYDDAYLGDYVRERTNGRGVAPSVATFVAISRTDDPEFALVPGLFADRDAARRLLLEHLVPVPVWRERLGDADVEVTTATGGTVRLGPSAGSGSSMPGIAVTRSTDPRHYVHLIDDFRVLPDVFRASYAPFLDGEDVPLGPVGTLAATGEHEIFLRYLNETFGLWELENPDLVVFAPTDAAFRAAFPNVDAIDDSYRTIARHLGYRYGTDGEVDSDELYFMDEGRRRITRDEGGRLLVDGAETTPLRVDERGPAIYSIGTVLGTSTPDGSDPEEGREEPEVDDASGRDPTLRAIAATGSHGNYLQIYDAVGFGGALDENAWTVFVPTDDALDDAAVQTIVSSVELAVDMVRAGIVTEAALSPDQLSGSTGAVTNTGIELSISVDDDAGITVNGLAATRIETPGPSVVYSIEGLLQ